MSAYTTLCRLAREIALLNSTASVLGWDQETYLPEKAVDYRASQLSYLSAKAHELATGRRFRSALEKAEKETQSLDDRARANLREWRHEQERAIRIPTALVAEESEVTVQAKHVWAEARKRSDFSMFAPHLRKLVDISRTKAKLWGYRDEPYDALLSGYERGALTSEIAALFGSLGPKVSKIAKKAVERSKGLPSGLLTGKYAVEKQQKLNQEIAESIGFLFNAGRVDTTTHPFCTTLGPRDVRLTTRYDERDFTSSLFGVLHEAGHGLYEQGLLQQDYGLPSGAAVSLGIHESQSRLWENHVGRSAAFWEKWYPRAQELFSHLKKVSLEDFVTELHRSEFSFIRVEADEATYDLHIILRFEMERRLLNGTLEVDVVPQTWSDLFEKMFGVRPPDDARGCLQDIHWSMGGLGYFPTYTLGNLNAAQIFRASSHDKEVARGLKTADYKPLLDWLRTEIHTKGSTLFPQALMKAATGEATQEDAYVAHLKKRFTE